MKICVLMKQVPNKDSHLDIDMEKNIIKESAFSYVTNESDNYALEEALQIKEAHDSEVVVCTLGPESAKQVIKDALSKGADRGIFFNDAKFLNQDVLTLAKIFASILKNEKFDLILSGLQSDDLGNGQLGLLIAELLNTSHASLVMETNITDNGKIKAKQELEGGWFQWTELDLPASLTIQSGINTPRYASLRGIMMMKKKPIDIITATEVEKIEASKLTMEKMYIPKKTKETIFLEGNADKITDDLIEIFSNQIKVL